MKPGKLQRGMLLLWFLRGHVLLTLHSQSPPLRACLHGGEGPQVGEVTRLGGVTRLSI